MVISKMRKFDLLVKPQALHHLASLLILLTGCTVGPNFTVPNPPDVPSLKPPPIVSYDHPLSDHVATDSMGERFRYGQDIPGEWWTIFRSKELTELMQLALRDNYDLKTAQAALGVARANYEAQKGAFFPTVGLNEISSRQEVATADLISPTISGSPFFTLHTAQLTVSYVPDVFGGVRRQVEAASSQAEAQRFVLEATYLTLTSNIALAAIQEASLFAQLQETKDAIWAEKQLYKAHNKENDSKDLIEATPRDWAALETAIAQAEQTKPLLKKQLAAQRDLLIALSGQYAGAGLPEHLFFLDELQLPKDLPVSIPSQLVEQRPDVRAAEANLHTTGALVGVAIANRIPLFNLTGNIGSTSSQFNNLINPAPPFLFWTIAGSVTQTVFDGFTLAQRQRAAEAGWEQAAMQYQSTLVTAFQNVADVLQAIELDSKSVKSARQAAGAARKSLCLHVAAFVGYDGTSASLKFAKPGYEQLVRRYFDQWWGQVCRAHERDLMSHLGHPGERPTGIDVLTAEQVNLASRLSLRIAEATRYADVVALFQALGGGWWNRPDVEGDRRVFAINPSLLVP
jgi:NodT family efflux transporter outer membrane factor (OMF) lipoprotein